MSTELDLLRMLEPAVRPGGLPAPARQQQVPIESRDFEMLLEEARSMDKEVTAEASSRTAGSTSEGSGLIRDGLMGQLAGVQRIENSSLRQLLQNMASTNG